MGPIGRRHVSLARVSAVALQSATFELQRENLYICITQVVRTSVFVYKLQHIYIYMSTAHTIHVQVVHKESYMYMYMTGGTFLLQVYTILSKSGAVCPKDTRAVCRLRPPCHQLE